MKIAINLLPSEIIAREIKKTRFYKIQAIGVGVILVMIFLASLTIALRILQSQNITNVQASIAETEQRVSGLKNTQASLLLLKNRLSVIDKYFGVPSRQTATFELIDELIPPAVIINAININKTDEVVLLALVPDAQSLDALMNNLTEKQNNGDKIRQVSVESLSRGKDGFYRISLKIRPK